MAAGPAFDASMGQIAEQHKWMVEQHFRWVDVVTDSAVTSLREENRRLSEELLAMKSLVVKRGGTPAPPVPELPARLTIPDFDAPRDLVIGLGPETWPRHSPTHGKARRLDSREAAKTPPQLPGAVGNAWAAPPSDGATTPSEDASPNLRRLANAASMRSTDSKKLESRELRRLRTMFSLPVGVPEVPFDKLSSVVCTRLAAKDHEWVLGVLLGMDAAREAMSRMMPELSRPELGGQWFTATSFLLDGLVLLLGPDGDSLVQCAPVEKQEDLQLLRLALQTKTVDEVIDLAAKGTVLAPRKEVVKGRGERLEQCVNTVVIVTVLLNVFAIGVSIDHQPEHIGWLALEVLCVSVFVAEALFKIWMHGFKEYVAGPAKMWNLIDLLVMACSAAELVFSVLYSLAGDAGGPMAKLSNFARPIVLLRTVRIIRVIRLVKLLYSPLLRDLANMLVGFVIGVPSLFWVLAVFCCVLYLLALVFRLLLGPVPGQDLIFGEGCGWPDDVMDYNDPVCKIHFMYGEEFFGSVSSSMFTAFRFMLGDYSTRGGKSMIIALSAGYGIGFDVVFVTFMLVVMFGFFNIITAIFVDSTTAGLKHNDVKRKYAQQYEREFVREKLRIMVMRVGELMAQKHGEMRTTISAVDDEIAAFALERDDFVTIMKDPVVLEAMQELDIDEIGNPAGMFDTFDADDDGEVSMLEFVTVMTKLRGESGKTDVIECVVSIRNLQAQVADLALMLSAGPRPPSAEPQRALSLPPASNR